MNRNGRRENASAPPEHFVRRFHCPTQAKTGLEWATSRSAIVVTPKQPFLDWLRAVDPTDADLTLLELTQDPTIYLIPECDTDEDVVEAQRDLYEEIFEEELAGWCTDESVSPRDRSFDVFRRWFDYQHHSMLMDLCDEPLIRDVE